MLDVIWLIYGEGVIYLDDKANSLFNIIYKAKKKYAYSVLIREDIFEYAAIYICIRPIKFIRINLIWTNF
jgi:hypothetical protein